MILGTNTDIKVNLVLDENEIRISQEVIQLGITIDDKLSFKTYIENICRKKKQITRVTTHKYKYRQSKDIL